MTKTIRDQAEAAGLTLNAVRQQSKIPRETFYRRMRTGEGWTLLELSKVAHVLGMEPAELIGRGAAA